MIRQEIKKGSIMPIEPHATDGEYAELMHLSFCCPPYNPGVRI